MKRVWISKREHGASIKRHKNQRSYGKVGQRQKQPAWLENCMVGLGAQIMTWNTGKRNFSKISCPNPDIDKSIDN